jgi:hypothetical protein
VARMSALTLRAEHPDRMAPMRAIEGAWYELESWRLARAQQCLLLRTFEGLS